MIHSISRIIRYAGSERCSVAVIGAAAFALTISGPGEARSSAVYVENGWRLFVQHDSFTASSTCELRSRDGRMVYQPGALGFRFGRRRDTTRAWYRVDESAPRKWQDDYPALIAAGVEIDGPALSNPTGGIVWVPLTGVMGAHMVRVRPGGRGNGQPFRPAGLSNMLAAATRLNCRFS